MLDATDKDKYAIEIKMIDLFLKLPVSLETQLTNLNNKAASEWS